MSCATSKSLHRDNESSSIIELRASLIARQSELYFATIISMNLAAVKPDAIEPGGSVLNWSRSTRAISCGRK